MKLCIRADASPKIGMGHVMRCMAMAEVFSDRGCGVMFVSRDTYGREEARKRHFDWFCEPNADFSEEGAGCLLRLMKREGADAVLVDSYEAGDGYLTALQQNTKCFFIDGLYRCGAEISGLLNYNAAADPALYRERFSGKKTALMIGPSYVPLRRDFREACARAAGSGEEGPRLRVMITTGASDGLRLVPVFCEALKAVRFERPVEYHIVQGGLFEDGDEIAAAVKGRDEFVIHKNVASMSGLMAETDLAVTAAGTTVYELLAMRIPSVVFAVNEIQRTFKALEPAILWTGDIFTEDRGISAGGVRRVTEALEMLVRDAGFREEKRRLAAGMLDAEGVYRIADTIMNIIGEKERKQGTGDE
ncbi:MAG: UDP-2,4-diacetamido-2,4,6-trideoxy-beta-L-altropyranose hydrolase [Lachnospiraceae bacterium]|nr:UDP-2,4-diacetamido-2,4,6-trideoxy-beta-L-altropyranose hydrolase [Lachnospiraceae bacterium]